MGLLSGPETVALNMKRLVYRSLCGLSLMAGVIGFLIDKSGFHYFLFMAVFFCVVAGDVPLSRLLIRLTWRACCAGVRFMREAAERDRLSLPVASQPGSVNAMPSAARKALVESREAGLFD